MLYQGSYRKVHIAGGFGASRSLPGYATCGQNLIERCLLHPNHPLHVAHGARYCSKCSFGCTPSAWQAAPHLGEALAALGERIAWPLACPGRWRMPRSCNAHPKAYAEFARPRHIAPRASLLGIQKQTRPRCACAQIEDGSAKETVKQTARLKAPAPHRPAQGCSWPQGRRCRRE